MPNGFSPPRLERLVAVVDQRVARGDAVGAVTLLARGDDVHVHTAGLQDHETRAPMRRDTLFRVASITKTVVAVAALSLVEDAVLRLDEPVDRLLPELAGRRVLRSPTGPLDDTVPADRALTLRDLLTFRAGIGMVFTAEGDYPLQAAIAASGIGGSIVPHDLSPDEMMKRYGALPLMHQPGTVWRYHHAYDLVGVLVARAAGKPLDEVLEERVLGPLAMKDTGFNVPDDKASRLASAYQLDRATRTLVPYQDGYHGRFDRSVRPAGAVGLFSTADDLLALGRMLRDRGKVGTKRLLARTTVDAMLTDQIPAEQKAVSPFFPGFWDHRGWGFGVSMITSRGGPATVPGRFGWDGGLGTTWFIDPTEDLVAVLLTQRVCNPFTSPLHVDFATLAYAALDP